MSLHLVSVGQSAGGPMLAVKAVLQINLGFSDHVIFSNHVKVIDSYCEQRLHWEGGLNIIGPESKVKNYCIENNFSQTS